MGFRRILCMIENSPFSFLSSSCYYFGGLPVLGLSMLMGLLYIEVLYSFLRWTTVNGSAS